MNRWMQLLMVALVFGLIACGQNGAVGSGQSRSGAKSPAAGPNSAGKTSGRMAGQMRGGERQVEDAVAVELKPEHEVLGDPSHEKMKQTAPAEFDALFHTTAGDFTVHVTREWAPEGADRFYNLVVNGYYDGNRFFRVVPGFVVQWGMHGDPDVNANWRASDDATIPDDEVTQSNTRGTITFATSGEDSRTTQLFINFGNNARLDGMGFSVFGTVVGDGMDAVDSIESKYGQRPDQGRIHAGGNEYLDANFPDLDHIISATIVEAGGDDAPEEDGE